jgi:tRNA pseudouridine13 synthase
MLYASDNIPACPGIMKAGPEDFRVDEIPAYAFSGDGDHVLVQVEKTGLSTFEALRRICRELKFNERDAGYAGLKDAVGVTRQWFSFEHVDADRIAALQIPKLRIAQVTRHGNKLKRGHLSGNRFEVTLREVAPENVPQAQAALAILQKRGVPNWYDEQRFGRDGNNDVLGLALIRQDWAGFFDALLGNPEAETHLPTRAARQAVADGNLAEALNLWPRNANFERAALKAVLDYGPIDKAVKRLPQKNKQFYVSALQSRLFNRCLEQRFAEYDRVWQGDLCEKDNGACFEVTDATADQARADALEISPTGPIFGHKMQQPTGRAAELEQAVLAEAGLTPQSFEVGGGLSQKGDRRAYRFALRDVQSDYDAESHALKLAFTLPKGCYATVVLKEITKDGR